MNFIRNRKLFENYIGWGFILPAILFISIFILFPAIKSIYLPFFEWDGIGELNFVGLKNFIKMFTRDRYFYTALRNTFIFSTVATTGTIIVGFILAVIIDLRVRFWKIYRVVFFLPYTLSIVAVSMLWLKVFEPNGLLNNILRSLNLGRFAIPWFVNPNIGLGIMLFVSIWQYSSFPMIFFLAGMQGINEEIYESAKIDGTSTVGRIVSITMPLLKNVFSILIVMQLIFSFRVFDIVWIMTGGGPSGKTEVLGTLIYRYSFKFLEFGYASVLSMIALTIAIILAFVYRKISGYGRLH